MLTEPTWPRVNAAYMVHGRTLSQTFVLETGTGPSVITVALRMNGTSRRHSGRGYSPFKKTGPEVFLAHSNLASGNAIDFFLSFSSDGQK